MECEVDLDWHVLAGNLPPICPTKSPQKLWSTAERVMAYFDGALAGASATRSSRVYALNPLALSVRGWQSFFTFKMSETCVSFLCSRGAP